MYSLFGVAILRFNWWCLKLWQLFAFLSRPALTPYSLESNLCARSRPALCHTACLNPSLRFTHIYAALVAVLNTKLPENGELLVKRVVVGFRRAYKRRDKVLCCACTSREFF